MKKKLGIILLALLLLTVFTACDYFSPFNNDGDDYEAYSPEEENDELYDEYTEDEDARSPEEIAIEIYNDIVQLFSFIEDNEPGAFDVDAIIKVDMNMLGYDINAVIDANLRIVSDGHQTQMVVYTNTDMSDLGTPPIDADMYVMMENNTITDFRIFTNGEDFTDLIPAGSIDDMLHDALTDINNYPEFDESAIRSVDVDSVGDNTIISLLLYSDMLSEFVADIMEAYTELFDAFGVEFEIDIADLLITFEIDSDGNPLTMIFDMLMRLSFPDNLTGELAELSGEEMQISMVVHYYYNAFGDDVEIIWPEAGSRPAADTPRIPEMPTTFPDPDSRTITVPDNPAELDELLLFLELFDLDTVVTTMTIDGGAEQQHLSVFPSPGTFERLEIFYAVTGIEIDPMEIMQAGAAVFLMYLEMTVEQRTEFFLLVAALD